MAGKLKKMITNARSIYRSIGIAGKPAKKKTGSLHYEELEQRVLFSADIAPTVDAPIVKEQVVEEVVIDDLKEDNATEQAVETDTTESKELVFIDETVADYEHLLDDLQNSDDSRTIEVVVLESDKDGIEQISNILADRSDLTAVHFITHGSEGEVNLGNNLLNQNTLEQNSEAVSGWGSALTETGDFLFYGCNLAADTDGKMLVDSLAVLTGADVSASTDNTGHSILGADWDLEYTAGSSETSVAVSQDMQDNWGHILNVAVDATSTGTSGSGSSNLTISHTTSGTNRLMLVGVSMAKDDIGDSVSSITYNGDNLTLVGVEENGTARVEIWSIVNPDVGTHNIIINLNDPADGMAVGAMTFTGVDQSTALGTFSSGTGYGGTGSATVSSDSDEMVFGVITLRDSTDYDLTPGSGQTENWDLKGNNANGGGGD